MTQTNVNPISQVGLAQAILSDKEISPRILRMLVKETFTDTRDMAYCDIKGTQILNDVLSLATWKTFKSENQDDDEDYFLTLSNFAVIGLYEKDFAIRNKIFVEAVFTICETVSLDIGRYFSCKKLIGRYINDTLDQKIPFYEDDLMSMSDMIWAYENSPDNLEDTPF